jgi:hypothetical protein
MDSWARDLAERKNRELEAKLVQQEKDLSDRKMLTSHADPAWIEVRKQIDEAVKDFNEWAKPENLISYHAASDHNRMVLQINNDTHTIVFMPSAWTIMGINASYKLSVIAGNGIIWKNDGGDVFTPQLIARNQVEAVVNKRNY